MEILKQITVNNMSFNNRVVMAPMVPFGLPMNDDGTMSEEVFKHYTSRLSNNLGMLITQTLSITTKIEIDGGIQINKIEHIAKLKKLAIECHKKRTRFFVQIGYPSVAFSNGGTIDSFSEQELSQITNEFVTSIQLAKMAGCDGVELHGAHEFFLNMLASPTSNTRIDNYGGDISKRLYLVKNILSQVKNLISDDFIISYRMGLSGNKDLDICTAQALQGLGIGMLHLSSGITDLSDANFKLDSFETKLQLFTAIKNSLEIPTIVVGGIETISRGEILISKGVSDFVAYGKPFLADNNFMLKSSSDNDYAPCLKCRICQWMINGEKCPAVRKRMRSSI